MAKLRKMLGKVDEPAVQSLMEIIETQSKETLAAWAVGYVKTHTLAIYEKEFPQDNRLSKAVEAVDECVGRVVDAALSMDGAVIITADHGNADRMIGDDGKPFTPHSTNPVPFCVVGYDCELKETGRLADIAPTMLKILGLPQPAEMTGECMIK